MKVGVISLGCAKNLVDSEYLLGLLRESGIEVVSSYKEAYAMIINTCGFIESAKTEAIDTILEAAEHKKDGLQKLIVMGCLSQRYRPQLEQELPEVDRFITIDEYGDLGQILTEVLEVPVANTYGKSTRVLSGKPWMAYLRIADGCDNQCSYCAIPLIRGKFVSRPMEEIIDEARELCANGVKELNLIAQDSSRYGIDRYGSLKLSELLKQLDEVPGVQWIRILYLYPDEIPDDLVDTIRTSRHVLPYFDIPIQHGSNRMLRAMHRRGNRELILDRCQKLRASFDHAVLRTTLIAGFPGETLEDHEENLSLLKEIRWDHLGAFTYSKEEDTPAYDMEDDVAPEEKTRRMNELMEAQSAISHELLESLLGSEQEVLVERIDPLSGMAIGRGYMQAPDNVDGVVRVRCHSDPVPGTFVKARFTKVAGLNLIGEEV
ncbi:MAG: 30S ribosomal protein S12 methylthiotransferase RimO [Solobacterium sp.]|nr:30S ribosomal protein S12 methylthiotransferase RimO [Solobacterium sp.]